MEAPWPAGKSSQSTGRPQDLRADLAGASSSEVGQGDDAPPPSAATHRGSLANSDPGRWEGRTRSKDPNIPPEKLKRMIANRISARKTRIKRWEHVVELEKQVNTLEAQISVVLKPQIERLTREQKLLELERKSLMLKTKVYEHQEIIRNAEIEAKQTEVRRLREFQRRQIETDAFWDREQQAHISKVMMPQRHQDSELISCLFGQTTINPNYQLQGQIGGGENASEEMSGMMMMMMMAMGEQNVIKSGWNGSDDPMSVNLPAGPGGELGLQNKQSGADEVEQNDADPWELLDLDLDLDADADEIERLLNRI